MSNAEKDKISEYACGAYRQAKIPIDLYPILEGWRRSLGRDVTPRSKRRSKPVYRLPSPSEMAQAYIKCRHDISVLEGAIKKATILLAQDNRLRPGDVISGITYKIEKNRDAAGTSSPKLTWFDELS